MATIEINPTKIKSLPKFRNARIKFNWPPHHFLGFLCAFWGTVGENNETGEISDWTPDFLAEAVGIGNVDPHELWEALVEFGYIDVRDDGRVLVTDWIQIAGDPLERKYHSSNPQHLDNIWALHGQIRRRTSKNPKGDLKDTLRQPKGDLEADAPPDIIKEPPKDREKTGNASLSPWETGEREAEKEAPRNGAGKDRREPKTRSEVTILQERFFELLKERHPKLAGVFEWGRAGKAFREMLDNGLGIQEIALRFPNYLASTDSWIVQHNYNVPEFQRAFPQLEDGPISNHGRSNARRPFDDGAATVTAEPESAF